MSIALAVKYRPKTFSDVTEQGSIKTILENQIENIVQTIGSTALQKGANYFVRTLPRTLKKSYLGFVGFVYLALNYLGPKSLTLFFIISPINFSLDFQVLLLLALDRSLAPGLGLA